jgi:iron complex outermembrane recepter protein
MGLRRKPGSNDAGALSVAGNSPQTQAAIRSYIELPGDFSLYASVRYVSELPAQRVPSYTALDWSLDWQPTDRSRAALTVHNANDARRLEFGGDTLIERSALLRLHGTF